MVEPVIPLPDRVGVDRVALAVHRRDHVWERQAAGEVRNAQRDHAAAPPGLVRRQRPHRRAAPIVADPQRRPGPERVVQLAKVGGRLAHGIVGGSGRDRRAAIAAHVGRDAAPARRGEVRELMPPDQPQPRPAVNEDHQRAVGRARLKIGGTVPACFDNAAAQVGRRHASGPAPGKDSGVVASSRQSASAARRCGPAFA